MYSPLACKHLRPEAVWFGYEDSPKGSGVDGFILNAMFRGGTLGSLMDS
jgi:hypothetical protein